MGAPMLSPLIHSVLRIVGRMTDQERRETLSILQSAYPEAFKSPKATTGNAAPAAVESPQPKTDNAAKCRRWREKRRQLDTHDTRVATPSDTGRDTIAVVVVPVVAEVPVVPVVQEPATTETQAPVVPVVSGKVLKAPRVEGERAATALAHVDTGVTTPSDTGVTTLRVTSPRSDVQTALDRFHETFLERNGSKPHITGKDANLAKQLVTRHGLGKVLEVMEAMFDSLDPFIAQAGPSFGLLSSQWNKLVQAPREHISERTRGNLNAVKAFLDARR